MASQVQTITPNDTSPPLLDPSTTTTLFLAGPTNQNWRDTFIQLLTTTYNDNTSNFNFNPTPTPATTTTTTTESPFFTNSNITIIDPTQPKWDGTWSQDYQDPNDARFRNQVDWELEKQAKADLVVFYFVAGQQAPVSLLELGLVLGQYTGTSERKVLVGCEDGYCKRGNVQAVCARYGVPLTENLKGLVHAVVAAVQDVGS